ncbi:MAG: YihY/virulence factor BrkB family protein [Thermoactinomyces sp.]
MYLVFFRELKRRIFEERLYDLSAQLAYYFLMSLFPFLLLAVTLLGYLPISEENILRLIEPYAPADTYALVEYNLSIVLGKQQGGIFSVSLFITLYLASIAFQSIIRILNNAYRVERNRPFIKQWFLGVLLMFGLLLAVLVSLLLPVFGKVIGEFVFSLLGMSHFFYEVWIWLRWLISSFVLFLVFLSVYKFAPNIKIPFKEALPGALFATFGWQLSSLGFAYYVTLNNYAHIYGNLGALIVMVGWFYLSALILILGGMINATLSQIKR